MRRTAARLGTMLVALIGPMLIGASPALAAGYSVNLGLPSGFRAGGSPGTVVVKITRGEKGCVTARWEVTVDLAGMVADQIRVERALAGAWHDVSVQPVGDGVAAFGSEGPLCKGRAIAARYRVGFLAGTPGGRASFLLRASANGRHIGSDSGTRKVIAAKGVPPPSPSASPTQAAEPTGPTEAVAAAPTPAATTGAKDSGGGFLSGVTLIFMIFGILMIGTGAVLLYLIIGRRSGVSAGEFAEAPPGVPWRPPGRPEPPPRSPGPPPGSSGRPPGDPAPTMLLPRIPDD